MYKIPVQLLKDKCVKDTNWHSKPNSNKRRLRWIRAYLLLLLVWELPDISLCVSVAGSKVEHEGFCPNKLNANLWVDAQSTCERECNVDEVMSFIFMSHISVVKIGKIKKLTCILFW